MLQHSWKWLTITLNVAKRVHPAQSGVSSADDIEPTIAGDIFGAQNKGVVDQVYRFAEYRPDHKEAACKTQSKQTVLWGPELLFDCAHDFGLFGEVRHKWVQCTVLESCWVPQVLRGFFRSKKAWSWWDEVLQPEPRAARAQRTHLHTWYPEQRQQHCTECFPSVRDQAGFQRGLRLNHEKPKRVQRGERPSETDQVQRHRQAYQLMPCNSC